MFNRGQKDMSVSCQHHMPVFENCSSLDMQGNIPPGSPHAYHHNSRIFAVISDLVQ